MKSLEIHTEMLGNRVRFHKIPMDQGARAAKNAFILEAAPFMHGTGGFVSGPSTKIGKDIEGEIYQHNKAEDALDLLIKDYGVVLKLKDDPTVKENPYVQEAAKKQKQSVGKFIASGPQRLEKEMKKAFARVEATNKKLPTKLRENHVFPDLRTEETKKVSKSNYFGFPEDTGLSEVFPEVPIRVHNSLSRYGIKWGKLVNLMEKGEEGREKLLLTRQFGEKSFDVLNEAYQKIKRAYALTHSSTPPQTDRESQ